MYCFMCYFTKMEHIAYYKANDTTQSNFRRKHSTYARRARTHTHTHAHTYTHTHARTHAHTHTHSEHRFPAPSSQLCQI